MNRPLGPAWAAIIVLPLLALSLVMPSGLDTALPPITAGVIPLAWATMLAVMARLSSKGIVMAYMAALPFSAYSLLCFSPPPVLPWLLTLASAACASSALARKTERHASVSRLVLGSSLVGGAAPGLMISLAAGYRAGIAVSLLIALVSLLAGRRQSR